jgi:hypothetical protein
MVQEWECDECGFVVKGHRAPSRCPECDAPQNAFFLLEEEEDEEDFEDYEDMDDWDDEDFDDDDFDDDED